MAWPTFERARLPRTLTWLIYELCSYAFSVCTLLPGDAGLLRPWRTCMRSIEQSELTRELLLFFVFSFLQNTLNQTVVRRSTRIRPRRAASTVLQDFVRSCTEA